MSDASIPVHLVSFLALALVGLFVNNRIAGTRVCTHISIQTHVEPSDANAVRPIVFAVDRTRAFLRLRVQLLIRSARLFASPT